jgi:hypothetical protein
MRLLKFAMKLSDLPKISSIDRFSVIQIKVKLVFTPNKIDMHSILTISQKFDSLAYMLKPLQSLNL